MDGGRRAILTANNCDVRRVGNRADFDDFAIDSQQITDCQEIRNTGIPVVLKFPKTKVAQSAAQAAGRCNGVAFALLFVVIMLCLQSI